MAAAERENTAGRRPWVAVVGSAMVDLISYVERMPTPGETVRASAFVQGFGGKGANQAAAASLHGARTTMVGCVGDDLFGPATIEDLRGYGVAVEHVRVVAGAHSGVASILVEPSGQNRIVLGMGANLGLDAGVVADAFDTWAEEPEGPDVLVCQLETPQAATAAAFERGRARGATTVLTPGPAATLEPAVLACCDWLVPNESELAVLLGEPPDQPVNDSLARAPALAAAWGVSLLVTVGAAGAVLVRPGRRSYPIAAPRVDVVDTTGAGDAAAGCFAASLAAGAPVEVAAAAAVAFASDSVTRRGTRVSYRRHLPVEDLGEHQHHS